MAQTYAPPPPVSSQSVETPSMRKVEEVQEAYIEQKEGLIGALDSTKSILGDLRDFNKNEWVVRYPHIHESLSAEPESIGDSTLHSSRPTFLRRSLTFADDPNSKTDIVVSAPRKSLTRSITLASTADAQNEELPTPEDETSAEDDKARLIPSTDLNVLRLDLKLGSHGTSQSAAALVSQLEKASIANLIDERLKASGDHIAKLRLRVEDTSSKVLVTGDLNAGKSTFVNALLRRQVMPVDQQPCTTAFCEVHDAAENGGVEEIHILKDDITYNKEDEATFTRSTLAHLEDVFEDNETSNPVVKVYLADTRAPSESLLNNGVVDISLIDAPGLNRDSVKTTNLFARQEEIDVIVFVASAENHFTLSATEFLTSASREKAYVFVVVNKYDQIKNKEKCRRMVLEQIKQFSPKTYEDAEDLVHFVDSASALQPFTANPAFDDLEVALRSFVLVKRSKSKLQPVATYLSNLLADVELISGANAIVAEAELQQARENLQRARPVLEKMKAGREELEDGLEAVEEEGVRKAKDNTRHILIDALDRVGQGKSAISSVSLPTYPGLLGIWDYARDVRRTMLASIDLAVKAAENDVRKTTSEGVASIARLGDAHLPEGVERSRRVFMPEAMFSARVNRKVRKSLGKPGQMVVAGGAYGLGIGLAHRPELLETTFFDLFDAQHHFWVHFGGQDSKEETMEGTPSALTVVSVGLGTLTMLGGQAIGTRAVLESIVRVTDLWGNESARKWAAPVIGAVAIGAAAYLVLELPSSVPKTVGRRIKATLVTPVEGETFVEGQAERVGRETRKVLRIASWDLKERFRGAMEDRGKEVKSAEESERKSVRAIEWFADVGRRIGEVRLVGKLVA